jgi:hypothetical protein
MRPLQDSFEDAPDVTPRPRAKSPVSGRSLTERRTSSATIDRVRSGDGTAEEVPSGNGVVTVEAPRVNGHPEKAEVEKRVSVSEMSDINLDGELHPTWQTEWTL